MNIHRVSGMFFCTLLLCQVSLAQQTAHVEGALLLGEKRNIRAGAGRVSGCNSERRRGEERQRLARSARASNPPSGMRSLAVATRWHGAFLVGAINTFIADVQLWQRPYGQPLQLQWPQPPLLLLEQSVPAGILGYSCPGQAAHGERRCRKLP